MKDKIKELGFSNVEKISVADIAFEPSLIELCRLNSCGNYGKNYTCPPYVGDTEKLIKEAKDYKYAFVFQKIYPLEDSFDIEGMNNARIEFRLLTKKVGALFKETKEKYKVLAAGGCSECEVCALITNEPCRFPDIAYPSLEAYAVNVSKLATLSGMKYINGQNTVTYFGMVLIKE